MEHCVEHMILSSYGRASGECDSYGNQDYYSSLLHGITAGHLGMMQTLQNTAARLIRRRTRHSSTMIMLHELHWLPIKKRVIYFFLFDGIQVSAGYDS